MPDTDGTLTEQEFMQTYKPLPPQGATEGEFFWDYNAVVTQETTHVWTVVEGDDPDFAYASAGYHIVNKVNGMESYLVTEVPWVEGTELGVWWEPFYDHDFVTDPKTPGECGECFRSPDAVIHQRPIETGPEVP